MKKILSLPVIILSFFSVSEGQVRTGPEQLVRLSGVVMDAGRFEPLSDAQIIINRHFRISTGSDGEFAIDVKDNDTVSFTRLGYKDLLMIVRDTLRGTEFLAGVYLQQDTMMISEVVIMPRLSSLRSDIFKPRSDAVQEVENARYNLAVSAYQGRISQNRLGDPAINYELLRQRQRYDAYTKGQIPGDKMVALSPLILIPAAYMLIHGLPEKPEARLPMVTEQELSAMHRQYLEKLRKQK